jgi:hypothetical protein
MLRSVAVRLLAGIIVVLMLAIGVWSVTYSGEDPRNIKYVLWKAGLYKMNIDSAAFTMVRDSGRDKLVVGKTKGELQSRFGNLLTLEQVSQYYRAGYNLGWKGKDVLFIRNSPWMIVFDHGRATELVLMKGY